MTDDVIQQARLFLGQDIVVELVMIVLSGLTGDDDIGAVECR